jgi:hypothetical protein
LKLTSNIPEAGKIQISTLPTQELPWEGIYFQDVPINISVVASDGYKFSHWSDPSLPSDTTVTIVLHGDYELKAFFERKEQNDYNVVINEIMYKPADSQDCGDWIELYNPSDHNIDVSGWKLKDGNNDHAFIFPANQNIKSDEYLIICKSKSDFSVYYPEVQNYIGELGYGFGEQDQVRLFDNEACLIDSLSYTSSPPWYPEADGTGASLELINYALDNTLPQSWSVSKMPNGTPGAKNSVFVPVINSSSVSTISLICSPNPIVNNASYHFNIPDSNYYILEIFDIFGNEIKTLLDSYIDSGRYRVFWDITDTHGRKIAPGIYLCRLSSTKYNIIQKCIVLN